MSKFGSTMLIDLSLLVFLCSRLLSRPNREVRPETNKMAIRSLHSWKLSYSQSFRLVTCEVNCQQHLLTLFHHFFPEWPSLTQSEFDLGEHPMVIPISKI